ncbi:MAG: glycosyltransferase [Bacteroidia bacterium]|nr:glycosyltransferase [Bacteroidia bacterium]
MVFSKLAFYKSSTNNVLYELKPVSVIIAARNEYKFLEKNLRGVLEQDYPDFEVIVVNDCSWDDSQKLLEYYQEVYHNLRICQLIEQEKYPTGKKFAITMGIKAAQNNQLLFTDADCEPASNQWLRLMQSKFQNKEIVLGYSPVKKYPGLLNLFIRYEGAFTAMAYFSAAIQKNAFMGVGRNLAYMRDLFFKHKGFASHQHILSGDDDLFINEAANEHNVSIQLHPDSFVYTEPKKTFEDWQRQKTRHVSTGKYYKPKHQLFLGGYYASLFLFYSCLIVAILLRADWRLLASMYAVRFILQTTILYFIFTKLKCINLIWFVPILDLLYLFYITVFGVQSVFVKNKKIW